MPEVKDANIGVGIDDRGEYKVQVYFKGGCSSESNMVKIGETASSEFFFYPNPNRGIFQIRYQNPNGQLTQNSVVIYDTKGALIKQEDYHLHFSYEKIEVDMRKQSQGLYLIIVQDSTGKKIASGRVVVLPK